MCKSAPLELEGITHGSWLNRNGQKVSYFHNQTQSDADFDQMCQCGLSQSCSIDTRKCNCDVKAPIWNQVRILFLKYFMLHFLFFVFRIEQ